MWCLTRGIGLVLAALTLVLSSDASAQTESKLLQGRASVLFTFVPVVQSGANSISVGEPSIDSLLQKFGVQDMRAVFARPGDPKHLAVYQRLGMDRVFEIRFDSMNTVTSVVEEFALNQLVEFVEAVGIVDAYDISPGDENFADQWYHSQPNDVDLDSPGAWAFDTTMILTKIAVIDAGIDSLHPELRPNLWKNQGEFIGNPPLPTQDGLDNDGNGYVDDIFGWDTGELDGDPVPGYRRLGQDCSRIDWFHAHGSRIVGPLMSVDNNFLDIIDQNIVGVIWHGSIINVKCLSDAGAASANTLAAGIQYAADAGAEIASISRGYIGSIGTLGMAVNYADALGVVMVAAVSYDTSAEGYPAGDIRVISVGAISPNGAIAFDHIAFDTSAVVAPGSEILTTEAPVDVCFETTHTVRAGTSYATPMVAGVAGIAMGRRWMLTNSRPTAHDIRQVIWNAIDDQTHPTDPHGFDPLYGRGRVNFEKAIYAVSRGDVDDNGSLSIADAVYLNNWIWAGGPAPKPKIGVGDCDCSSNVSMSDVVYLANYIFSGGPPPKICFNFNY